MTAMCEQTEGPYQPNKYTRYVTLDDWRAIIRGDQSHKINLIDPGYLNEPHQPAVLNEPRSAKAD